MGKQFGFSKHERVRRAKEFDRVFRQGTRRKGRLMSVRCLANGQGHPRLGIALSRAWRRAVARNRAKRLIREAFRARKHALPRGIDIVVVPWPGWRAPSVSAIGDELERLVAQAVSEERGR